jgi:hypothetical protein
MGQPEIDPREGAGSSLECGFAVRLKKIGNNEKVETSESRRPQSSGI